MARPDRYTADLGASIRRQYEQGTSCQAIADDIGVSYSATRVWLIRAGTEMRPASRTTRAHRPERAKGEAATGTVMVNTFTPRLGGRGLNITMQVRTQCKLCRHAITSADETVWRTATPLGLVHAYCQRGYEQGAATGQR